MAAIIDSVQPVVDLIVVQQQEYAAFQSEGFRDDLANAVTGIVAGKILDKIEVAHPFFLYALSKTPLTRILERTQPLADELGGIAAFAAAAREQVNTHYPDEAVRMAAVGISLAAPEFVSCEFVLNNVSDDQTVGGTAIGGATVSVPNPVAVIVTTLQEATEGYLDFSDKWIDKVEGCQPNELEVRLHEERWAQANLYDANHLAGTRQAVMTARRANLAFLEHDSVITE